jgi:hypothetical protein
VARYYDPELGRFIQADTIVPSAANPQSLNRYSYCYNNPLNHIDPAGHVGSSGLLGNLIKIGFTIWNTIRDTFDEAIDAFKEVTNVLGFGSSGATQVRVWILVLRDANGNVVASMPVALREPAGTDFSGLQPINFSMSANGQMSFGSGRGGAESGTGAGSSGEPPYRPPNGEDYVQYCLSRLQANPFTSPYDRYLDPASSGYVPKDELWNFRGLQGISTAELANIGPGFAYSIVWGTGTTALGAIGGEGVGVLQQFYSRELTVQQVVANPYKTVIGPAVGSWRDNFIGMTYGVSDHPFRTGLSSTSGIGLMSWGAAVWVGRVRDWFGP